MPLQRGIEIRLQPRARFLSEAVEAVGGAVQVGGGGHRHHSTNPNLNIGYGERHRMTCAKMQRDNAIASR